jgi:hypothetical protein
LAWSRRSIGHTIIFVHTSGIVLRSGSTAWAFTTQTANDRQLLIAKQVGANDAKLRAAFLTTTNKRIHDRSYLITCLDLITPALGARFAHQHACEIFCRLGGLGHLLQLADQLRAQQAFEYLQRSYVQGRPLSVLVALTIDA